VSTNDAVILPDLPLVIENVASAAGDGAATGIEDNRPISNLKR
jgi:hypothetical protein